MKILKKINNILTPGKNAREMREQNDRIYRESYKNNEYIFMQ